MKLRAALIVTLGALCGALPASASASLPPIRHVYTIVLENESASSTFGPGSTAPYLARTLRSEGAFVPSYYGIGHASNDNYVAMISGQAPNIENQADCIFFSDFLGTSIGSYGQVDGLGCVYPAKVQTIAGQLDATGRTWRSYNESMGADTTREAATCGHPGLNTQDKTQSQSPADAYATRHNPFVYFHSIIDDRVLCDTHVVSLAPLAQDLAAPQSPNYVFIVPNLCNDGHDATCKNGGPGGYTAIDRFLQTWVPQITRSRSYRLDGGLIQIIFDESTTSDTASCCGEIAGPGSPRPGIGGLGGGITGAVLLSPYIRPGTATSTAYNHYTLLRSDEDLFGLAHLGYAQLPGETSFGSDIFACAPAADPVAQGGVLPAGSEFSAARTVRHGRRHSLTFYSVGAASLRVVVTPARGRRHTLLTRTLSPCRSYTFSLPAGAGRVTLSAQPASGGVQSSSLRY